MLATSYRIEQLDVGYYCYFDFQNLAVCLFDVVLVDVAVRGFPECCNMVHLVAFFLRSALRAENVAHYNVPESLFVYELSLVHSLGHDAVEIETVAADASSTVSTSFHSEAPESMLLLITEQDLLDLGILLQHLLFEVDDVQCCYHCVLHVAYFCDVDFSVV